MDEHIASVSAVIARRQRDGHDVSDLQKTLALLIHSSVKRPGDDDNVPKQPLRRIMPVAVQTRYLFRTFDNVYSAADEARILAAYERAARAVAATTCKTLKDGSVIVRDGRVDVRLFDDDTVVPLPNVLQFVRENMHANVRLAAGLRALVVQGQTPDQPWHTDYDTVQAEPRYATLIVAIGGDVDDDMGPTEFQVTDAAPPNGLLTKSQLTNEAARVRLLLRRGQGLLFDGRIMHRGTASRKTRVPVVYQVFKIAGEADPNV